MHAKPATPSDRLRACSAAGKWTEFDAVAAWTGKDDFSEPSLVSPTAATIAVDLDQRSPKATSLG